MSPPWTSRALLLLNACGRWCQTTVGSSTLTDLNRIQLAISQSYTRYAPGLSRPIPSLRCAKALPEIRTALFRVLACWSGAERAKHDLLLAVGDAASWAGSQSHGRTTD